MSRYAFSRVPQPKVDAAFERFCVRQRERLRARLSDAHARYQRRVLELEPQPHIESRGLKQAWHRDTATEQARTEWEPR